MTFPNLLNSRHHWNPEAALIYQQIIVLIISGVRKDQCHILILDRLFLSKPYLLSEFPD